MADSSGEWVWPRIPAWLATESIKAFQHIQLQDHLRHRGSSDGAEAAVRLSVSIGDVAMSVDVSKYGSVCPILVDYFFELALHSIHVACRRCSLLRLSI